MNLQDKTNDELNHMVAEAQGWTTGGGESVVS